MQNDELLHWLSKERPGCFAYPLYLLFFLGPVLPIAPIVSVEHDGIKEPSVIYLASAICLPYIIVCLLSAYNKRVTFSLAYLFSFIAMSVFSVIYLGYKFYMHIHYYGYMGLDLVKAMVETPLYLAALSLVFFIVETAANRIARKKRESHQRFRPVDGPCNSGESSN